MQNASRLNEQIKQQISLVIIRLEIDDINPNNDSIFDPETLEANTLSSTNEPNNIYSLFNYYCEDYKNASNFNIYDHYINF